MAHYELSGKLSKYLDRHLIFPLLEFLQEKGLYAEDDVLKAKIALLQRTNMVDFAMDIHKDLYQTEDVPPEMMERRSEVVGRLRTLQKAVDPIIACLSNPNVIRNFRQDRSFNLQLLKDEFDIGPDHVDALYQYAKFQFDCGNYSSASELLQAYRPLVTTSERNLSVLWGKLAADILMVDYDAATEDIARLREAIDNAPFLTPLMQLQQRTWLMHWSLHVFWNHENGKNALIDLFLQPAFTSAITVNAQHLLRYLAAAVVVNKRRRNVLKELIRLIQTESYEYSDPITEFLECLFVNYDFDGAQVKLAECEAVIDADYFLTAIKAEFLENARLFVFETYCRIHQCIDIAMLAERLNMDQEAAEKWIANLILNARLNAKIDSKAGTVVMGVQSQSVQEALVEKAKGLSARTFTLANAVGGGAVARA
ncbi:eukaryotic translation initiation factor 3 subunit E [Raphidocelis subcapitata]|uniref:Eukaryotic translation initiation factor 3 subunit E n=1 Tax=Raphidocelis subcapitata TaxID=307507 RepID=A0A2V0PKD9_9CHLO|nr:eukaryotic translation initiation factor 3 subunit E [Raphidocelis subcapitata]|eukprot:GBG00265.1 eukaryotic translation initiation factor 3 subunit E [Raphidocelis subcapitata]